MDMETKQGKSWSAWKSPVGLGFFLLTASLALAIVIFTVLNIAITLTELHSSSSDAVSAAQQQQLEQEMQSSGATGATGTTGQ
jgi:hypothetical protein